MKPLLSIIAPLDLPRVSINHLLKLNKVSRAFRNRLHKEGFCHINDKLATWRDPLYPNDQLDVFLPVQSNLIRYKYPLDVLYEDEYFIAINKPAGLLMHPTSTVRDKTLANAIVNYYDLTGQELAFHPIHRLDKDTSGAVIIAKNPFVQYLFDQQKSPIVKTYTAFVEGFYPIEHSSIYFPIARKEGSIIERTISPIGASAHTDITRLLSNNIASMLRIVLHTGRTHQIRVHCSSLGHPLIGDDLYGGSLDNLNRQALHATKLSFYHPINNEPIHIVAPLPKDLEMLKNFLFS